MFAVQRFSASDRCFSTRFITLVVVSSIVLLVVLYRMSPEECHDPALHASVMEERRRQNSSRGTTPFNYRVYSYSVDNDSVYNRSDGDRISHATKLQNYTIGQHISRVMKTYNYSIGLVWPRDDMDDHNDRILSQIDVMNVYARQKRNRKLKIILRVGNCNFKHWLAGKEQFLRDGCPIVDCWLTNNRSEARDADALLISEFRNSSRKLYLPKPHHQIWIAQHYESPLHNRIDPKSVRGLINWTASYRHDSTVAFRIAKMIPSVQATTAVTPGEGSVNYAAGKTRLVAWFVSNCHASNERMRYARELARFIQVCHNQHSYSVSVTILHLIFIY